MLKCKECGEQVSSKAEACPNCGAKPPKKAGVLAYIVMFILAYVVFSTIRGTSTSTPTQANASATRTTAAATTTRTTTPTASKPAKPAPPKSAWTYQQSKDQMSGKVTGYLTARSNNTLQGWLKNGKAHFGYTCGSGFYVRANDLGFATDDVDCSQYGCTSDHYSRVKFDDGQPTSVTFSVWDDNNDGMSLQKSDYSNSDYEQFFKSSMRSGQKMYLEVELFNTDGKQQIAEFDLTGFTKALNRCT